MAHHVASKGAELRGPGEGAEKRERAREGKRGREEGRKGASEGEGGRCFGGAGRVTDPEVERQGGAWRRSCRGRSRLPAEAPELALQPLAPGRCAAVNPEEAAAAEDGVAESVNSALLGGGAGR